MPFYVGKNNEFCNKLKIIPTLENTSSLVLCEKGNHDKISAVIMDLMNIKKSWSRHSIIKVKFLNVDQQSSQKLPITAIVHLRQNSFNIKRPLVFQEGFKHLRPQLVENIAASSGNVDFC